MTGLACAVLLAVQAQQTQPTVLRPPTRYAEPPSQYEQLVVQYQRGEYDSAVSQAARTPATAFRRPSNGSSQDSGTTRCSRST